MPTDEELRSRRTLSVEDRQVNAIETIADTLQAMEEQFRALNEHLLQIRTGGIYRP